MTPPEALLDSNVIVAMIAEEHEHHDPSLALINTGRRFAVAAHSYAETFTVLTRRGAASLFRWPAEDAWDALESVAGATTLVGLTAGQTFDAIRSYARGGGIGPRLYDHLIGQVAVHFGISRIVTWNIGHRRGLFPQLEIMDPAAALQA